MGILMERTMEEVGMTEQILQEIQGIPEARITVLKEVFLVGREVKAKTME